MNDLRVMMTGAGAPGAPGIIECYRNNGERNIVVLGVDAKSRVSTVQELDYFEKIPYAQSPDFIETILKIAENYRIDVIQPLVTKELEVFASNRKLFEDAGIAVCVDEYKNLAVSNDKGRLLEILKKEKMTVPEYYVVNCIEGFQIACQKLGYPKKTICFKPCKSNGSRGFRIINSSIRRSEILFFEKPDSTFITYDEAVDILSEMEKIPDLLVMEYMSGDEYSVDVLANNGEVIYVIPRLRSNITRGISTECTIVQDREVIDYCREVIKILGLNGNIGLQVRKDEFGCVKMLEINPRVQGSIVCCAAANVNLPYYGIKLALGEKIPIVPVNWGTVMMRQWKEVFYDSSGRPYTY